MLARHFSYREKLNGDDMKAIFSHRLEINLFVMKAKRSESSQKRQHFCFIIIIFFLFFAPILNCWLCLSSSVHYPSRHWTTAQRAHNVDSTSIVNAKIKSSGDNFDFTRLELAELWQKWWKFSRKMLCDELELLRWIDDDSRRRKVATWNSFRFR